MTNLQRALIREFYDNPLTGEAIEERSFETIDNEYNGNRKDEPLWPVIRRMVHTCADFSIIDMVCASDDALASGCAALLAGKPIYADSNMIRAGISVARLTKVNVCYNTASVKVHVADEDVAAEARLQKLPRSLFALRKARPIIDGGIIIFGNAPIGLLELNRLIREEGLKPALVIAMPVGFVHVVESKAELMSLGVPFIALDGRRGGSTLAVSVIHALCKIAEGQKKKIEHNVQPDTKSKAIILLGHGSRVPAAAQSMELVADNLRQRFPEYYLSVAHMSLNEPNLESVFATTVKNGALDITVMPYFLHEGMHYRVDIPAIMRKCLQAHPEATLRLGKCIGYDDVMVDLIQKRIVESLCRNDIRKNLIVSEEEAMSE